MHAATFDTPNTAEAVKQLHGRIAQLLEQDLEKLTPEQLVENMAELKRVGDELKKFQYCRECGHVSVHHRPTP